MNKEELREKILLEKGHPMRGHETRELIDYTIKQTLKEVEKVIDDLPKASFSLTEWIDVNELKEDLKEQEE